jgi:hypothetical protein
MRSCVCSVSLLELGCGANVDILNFSVEAAYFIDTGLRIIDSCPRHLITSYAILSLSPFSTNIMSRLMESLMSELILW